MPKLGRKGYIGPLGDDFPSLFPLALGLILFFSAISTSYTAYKAKEDHVQSMRANVMISRAIRYQIYFDENYWNFACNLAMRLRANYGVHAAMWLEYPDGGGMKLAEFNREEAKCPSPDSDFWYEEEAVSNNRYDVITAKTQNRIVNIMTYPVIYVDKGGYDNPARLVVVTWR